MTPHLHIEGLRLKCLDSPGIHVDAKPTTPKGRATRLVIHLEVLPPEGEKDFEASIEGCFIETLPETGEAGAWTGPLSSKSSERLPQQAR